MVYKTQMCKARFSAKFLPNKGGMVLNWSYYTRRLEDMFVPNELLDDAYRTQQSFTARQKALLHYEGRRDPLTAREEIRLMEFAFEVYEKYGINPLGKHNRDGLTYNRASDVLNVLYYHYSLPMLRIYFGE